MNCIASVSPQRSRTKSTSSITMVVTRKHKKRKCSVSRIFCVLALLTFAATNSPAQTRPIVSVLDFGSTPIAKQVTDTLRNRLRSTQEMSVADADLSRAAAKGIGYTGSLNLGISEARDLG